MSLTFTLMDIHCPMLWRCVLKRDRSDPSGSLQLFFAIRLRAMQSTDPRWYHCKKYFYLVAPDKIGLFPAVVPADSVAICFILCSFLGLKLFGSGRHTLDDLTEVPFCLCVHTHDQSINQSINQSCLY